jgi:hypothetical protein
MVFTMILIITVLKVPPFQALLPARGSGLCLSHYDFFDECCVSIFVACFFFLKVPCSVVQYPWLWAWLLALGSHNASLIDQFHP